ncbi:MAG: TPM domain-containing protein [Thermomicrobiales bacterium]
MWRATLRLPVLLLIVTMLIGMTGASASAQEASSFPGLNLDQRVYDETGSSLTAEQVVELNAQLDVLLANGAEVIVLVRELDASPEETLDQVEALQQAWVATTGTNQDNAAAILINRNPNDANDARAGIFVGSTYDDGNVPEDEQRAIVDDELIPPLRDGDVFGSLIDGLDRLDSSIRNGPPKSGFEQWSSDAGSSWLPWAGLLIAIPGGLFSASAFRSRQTISRTEMPPTTDRPGDLAPALAGALVLGGGQPSAIPATLLGLAERGAVAIEPESEGGTFSSPKVQVRLLDESLATSEFDRALWSGLVSRADGDLVPSKELQKVSTDTKLLAPLVDTGLRSNGWTDGSSTKPRAWLVVIGLLAIGFGIFGIVVAAMGGGWMMLIGTIALFGVGIAALVMSATYSPLTREGQVAALPWKAYREGLKRAAKDRTIEFDLDKIFVDAVALNLGHDFDARLKEAVKEGVTLRAFRDQQGRAMATDTSFPFWIAYSTVFSSSSGTAASSSTASSGSAGGGGGAAGST